MPRPVGRPVATRGIYSFDDLALPPTEIVLETTFVAEALMLSQPRHDGCQAFLNTVSDSSTVYVSELLESELWETAYTIACRELRAGKPRGERKTKEQQRRDGRTRIRAKRLQREIAAAWDEARSALSWVSISVGEVSAWVPTMMGYGGIFAAVVLTGCGGAKNSFQNERRAASRLCVSRLPGTDFVEVLDPH